MEKRVSVLNMDAVKLISFLRQLEKVHFHGELHFKIYDGKVKQVKRLESVNLHKLWPETEEEFGSTGDTA